ncbi:MAG: hypothetical protein GY936_02895 [Ignavibacteriae bacterium]|nr:hypothetical protein [Ignavibacteriota bacterium]
MKNFNRPTLKIVVTDSGLGGLSVHALLDKHLLSYKNTPNIELIFFNALADHSLGYNVMKSEVQKIQVFNKALEAMLCLNPDIILIACNTLSALYQKTDVSKSVNIPVISIIDLGIDMVLENINNSLSEKIIIFGTETTIKSNQHKLNLIKQGVDESKIVTQACENLESEIQINPNSKKVEELIDKYITKALANEVNSSESITAVLACTHYGYSYSLFNEKLADKFKGQIKILNPNEKMGSIVKLENHNEKLNSITNKVISRVDITKTEMTNINLLLKKDSLRVAAALESYTFDPMLFRID